MNLNQKAAIGLAVGVVVGLPVLAYLDSREESEPVDDGVEATVDETQLQEEEGRLANLAAELEAREQEIEEAEQRLEKRAERQERAQIDDGIWEVGEDIRPGTYRAPGGDRCSWSIFETLHRRHDSWFDGKHGGSNQTVQLDAGWWFETEDCGTWEKLD